MSNDSPVFDMHTIHGGGATSVFDQSSSNAFFDSIVPKQNEVCNFFSCLFTHMGT